MKLTSLSNVCLLKKEDKLVREKKKRGWKAQEEVRDLSNSYPEYTMEIMEMVAVYEEKCK